MSKSEISDLSRINLTDDKDTIVNKIKKAKTDPQSLPFDIRIRNRPEAKNLLSIYSSLSNNTLLSTVNEFSGKNFSEFKESLIDILINKLEPISSEINKLMDDRKYLDKFFQ